MGNAIVGDEVQVKAETPPSHRWELADLPAPDESVGDSNTVMKTWRECPHGQECLAEGGVERLLGLTSRVTLDLENVSAGSRVLSNDVSASELWVGFQGDLICLEPGATVTGYVALVLGAVRTLPELHCVQINGHRPTLVGQEEAGDEGSLNFDLKHDECDSGV